MKFCGLMAAMVFIIGCSVASGAPPVTPVESVPVIAPGLPAPGTPWSISAANTYLSLRGNYVGVMGTTTGPGPSNTGVWMRDATQTWLAAYDGDTVTGLPTSLSMPSGVRVNRNGHLVFQVIGSSIVRNTGAGLQAAVLTSAPAPGTDNGSGTPLTFGGIGSPALADNGGIAFTSWLNENISLDGLWTDVFGRGLERLALEGAAGPNGLIYDTMGMSFRVNNNSVVHRPTLGGSATIVLHTAGGAGSITSQIIARTGDDAPGVPGAKYVVPFDPQMNASGQLAFRATLSGGPNTAIFQDRRDGSGPQLVVLQGQPAPGLDSRTFETLQNPVLNDAGRIAFNANFSGAPIGQKSGLWSNGRNGTLELIARWGEAAPGLDGLILDSFTNIALSDTGRIAWRSKLLTAGTLANAGNGLFVQDYAGRIQLVAAELQDFELRPGVIAQVADNGILFNADDRNQAFSGDQLIYRLSFTDGRTGIYTATVTPEPGALSLLLLAGALLTARRR